MRNGGSWLPSQDTYGAPTVYEYGIGEGEVPFYHARTAGTCYQRIFLTRTYTMIYHLDYALISII